MNVILLKPVKECGQAWEMVDVREGFARNFLIPKGLAVLATKERIEEARKHQGRRENAQVRQQKKTAAIKAGFLGKVLRLDRSASSEGNLYAAISRAEVGAALWDQFRLRISEDDAQGPTLKTLGQYTWTLKRLNETLPFQIEIKSSSPAAHEKTKA